ncbi:PH domain-containing protein [Streptomyces sp. NPDC052109]|uniref:PH domain-containing protein n=1 Tax=Streptomyces sp. NPDC052109 TaxID=3155527 RepID=UPI003432B192
MDEGESTRVYRRQRRRPRQAALLPLVLLGNAALQTIRAGHAVPTWWVPTALAALVAVGVWGILSEWRAHTVVAARGITRQGPLRARTWAWSAVYDIRVESTGNQPLNTHPRWAAYLYDSEGRRFLLPQLNEWQLDDPHAEVAGLRAAAWRHGMPYGQRAEIEERILRQAGRRRGWQGASVAAVVVFAVMIVVALAEDIAGTPANLVLLLVVVPLAALGLLGPLLGRYCAARALRLPRDGA